MASSFICVTVHGNLWKMQILENLSIDLKLFCTKRNPSFWRFVCVFQRDIETWRKRESFSILFYFPNDFNNQGLASTNSQARDSMSVSHMGGSTQTLAPSPAVFLGALAEDWIGSGAVGNWTCILIWNVLALQLAA